MHTVEVLDEPPAAPEREQARGLHRSAKVAAVRRVRAVLRPLEGIDRDHFVGDPDRRGDRTGGLDLGAPHRGAGERDRDRRAAEGLDRERGDQRRVDSAR